MNHLSVDLDAYRLDRFLRTGHPRTVGIALGLTKSTDGSFNGIEITRLSVDGTLVHTNITNERNNG